MSEMTSSTPSNPSQGSVPRVLSIAGTDPSGGAGTAADTKSITAAGGYAMAAVTALVAQNTQGVRAIHTPPTEFLTQQLAAVSDDVAIDAVKTGMLGTVEIIKTVAGFLDEHRPPVVVVDPVMVATSGDRLLAPDAEVAMREFCLRATVITPNIPELAVLCQSEPAKDAEEALEQARGWAKETGVAVIVKTGHLDSSRVDNIWVTPEGTTYTAQITRVETTNTHGTGCSLSSALATRLGAGDAPGDALGWVTNWLHEAIQHGSELKVGRGHGPVDHSHRARRLSADASAVAWFGPIEPLASPETLVGSSESAPTAAVAPVGPWTTALWQASEDLVRQIQASDFVAALVDGTLTGHAFNFYLGQDAQYLACYSRALAALAARAVDPQDSVWWAQSSQTCIVEEAALHRTWLAGRDHVPAGPVTTAYTDFLLARTLGDDYVVGVASVLPCFWLYAQVGAGLPQVPEGHPYALWLDTYRDPEFTKATSHTLDVVEKAFEQAGPAARARAAHAYLTACRHELEFFDQAMRV
ncbi:MAG: bifunctional hydroxymethylpyrimidine kinase/phosphomethylpyrimidine kinase [Cutibacterium avidum]|uniref:bifunctional hydroxymethylpyrimidine kinase/phosphomethylpyrimidine kinase n=1 Tax=Cutibacterium avidum TaxID=33010 RepID=UPI0015CF3B1A|nr:bifunctional hydroxymethylpyrimidine kinase/phosphomethylpyrimidine kinase [Cutibacterium avidum]MDU2071332.1 bifunctional hydroxymethylpyrimidine kinase/phosphomethylpyrimidine kinase [Cutibacterium avidum]MDU3282678.1 bifunctional hydroxymethylpyrimidine kinase/phosphomethylpyrimidine kinase [Cutibacterium avidum]